MKDDDSMIALPSRQELFIYAVTGAVRRQRTSLSLTAGELLAKVSESFDRASPDGSALFVMNKE